MIDLSNEEQTLARLQQQQSELEAQPHNGYADAVSFLRLRSQIEEVEDRIARAKQQADRGTG